MTSVLNHLSIRRTSGVLKYAVAFVFATSIFFVESKLTAHQKDKHEHGKGKHKHGKGKHKHHEDKSLHELLLFSLPEPPEDSDYYDRGAPPPAKVELGRLLFFDKILSGNQNISCATCHHPGAGSGDQLSLPVGEGGRGLGPHRDTGVGMDAVHERVPRNAPDIFNRGAKEFVKMFHDGRVELSSKKKSAFLTPAGKKLPSGLDNVLAAQALFPVTSGAEMAGQLGENPIADLAADGDLVGIWEALAERLRSIPEYKQLFKAAFPHAKRGKKGITFAQAANAIAAFEAHEMRFDDSPFDQYLRGDADAMNDDEKAGMALFYGKAKCASCHSGTFMTDHQFHVTSMPQVGPGKGHGTSGYEDFGREGVTGDSMDRYKFRTPSLRNVALSGPWGHGGAFRDLREAVIHQLDPIECLAHYDRNQPVLPSRTDLDAVDWMAMDDAVAVDQLAEANELDPVALEPLEIDQLVTFLYALTDLRALDMMNIIPENVPSGLPVID
ncbi:MAG: cytochrome c peroxidase [Verrucomicrobiota bacterium]|nr:cytochrome c peroxidase [Verrucomicrobiota bacterium]